MIQPKTLQETIFSLTPLDQKRFIKECTPQERYLSITQQECDEQTYASLKSAIHTIQNSPSSSSIAKDNSSKITHATLSSSTTLGALTGTVLYHFGQLTEHQALSLLHPSPPLLPSEKRITTVQLRKLLQNERRSHPNTRIHLRELLKRNGYSTTLYNLNLDKALIFQRVDLEDIHFNHCTFDGCHLSRSKLNKVVFEDCKLGNVSLMSSQLTACTFQHCEMQEVMFTRAKVEQTSFQSCNLTGCSFEDVEMAHSSFTTVKMPATHFLGSTVHNSSIQNSYLQDTVFFHTLNDFHVDESSQKTALLSAPPVSLLVDPESRGLTVPKAYLKLDEAAHCLPLRISFSSEPSHETKKLKNEIESLLQSIGPRHPQKPPIAQQLLSLVEQEPEKYPQSAKILQKVRQLASQLDGFFLPGGEDIPPLLYGQKEEPLTYWSGDYRRSLLELAMIHESFRKGIPLMAICRGFQMSHVYFGSSLLQHVSNHKGLQTLQLASTHQEGLYKQAMRKPIVGACFHHQGVPVTAAPDHLEAAVTFQGLIKASESKYSGSVPMILLQFHPEFYDADTALSPNRRFQDFLMNQVLSPSNEVFWEIFSHSASAHQKKKDVLQEIQSLSR